LVLTFKNRHRDWKFSIIRRVRQAIFWSVSQGEIALGEEAMAFGSPLKGRYYFPMGSPYLFGQKWKKNKKKGEADLPKK
jgi:hypothetical protein